MAKISTLEAAELMLSTGDYYSAAKLAQATGIKAQKASGLIFNIRTSKKYTIVETPLPNRMVKVLDIEGRNKRKDLWSLALGFTNLPRTFELR